MLTNETEKLIIKFLLEIAKKEKEVEINRQILAQNSNFDIFQLFSYMDREKKNYIDTFNIMDFFHRNAIYPNKIIIDFLILLYDDDNDNKLSYTEFLNMILSQNNISLRKSTREKIGSFNNKNDISFEIEHCVLKLLEKEVDFIVSVNKIIFEIKEKKDFNLHNIFHLLIGYQYITHESLTNYFNKKYVSFTKDDINFIMRRIDLNKDGKIDFKEFHTFFCFNDPNCNCPIKNFLNCCLCNENYIYKNKIYPNNLNLNLYFNYENNNNCCTDCTNINYKYNFDKNNNITLSTFQDENTTNISNNLSVKNIPEIYYSENLNNDKINSNINYNQFLNIKIDEFNSKINNFNRFSTNENNQCCCQVCQYFPCKCLEIGYEKGEMYFLNYIIELIEMEKKIEKAKIDLSLRSDFNIYDIFNLFLVNDQNYLTDEDLFNGLNLFDINLNEKDIRLLKRRMNKKITDIIFYYDFIDLLIPYEKYYRNMVESRIGINIFPENDKTNIFLLSTKNYFIKLINLIIECENKIEKLRYELIITRNQIKNIFRNIDSKGLGTITDIDLFNFLKNRGIDVNINECSLLFIRLDKNRDGKVECWELNEELEYTQ